MLLCKSSDLGKILRITTKFVVSSSFCQKDDEDGRMQEEEEKEASSKVIYGMVCIEHEQGWMLDKRSDPSDIPTVVLIIDTSGSMGQGSNRLHYAKQALIYFATKAYERRESNPLRIAIVGFCSTATLLMPPTMNPEPPLVEAVCGRMAAHGGTDFESALRCAVTASELHMGLPTVFVFFTDGRDASGLQAKMSVHPKYSDCALLSRLREAENLQIHTIAIDDGAPLAFLGWIATLPKRSGEVQQIVGEEMPKVVGAVLANIEESVDQCVEVVLENAARTVPIVVPLQVCSPPIGTKVAFFIDAEEGDFGLYLRVGHEIIWRQGVYLPLKPEMVVSDEEEAKMIMSLGLKFFAPCVAANVAKMICDGNDFEEALKVITNGISLLSSVEAGEEEEMVTSTAEKLSDLRTKVQNLQTYVRQMSEAGTDAGQDIGAMVASMNSEALTQFRSQSGAPPLIERDDGRQMSQSARSLSMTF